MATLTASLVKLLPPIFQNPDTQIAILGFLCFVGAWVIITKIIQFVFSILWPLIVLGGLMIMAPNFSTGWFTENLPRYSEVLSNWLRKQATDYYGRTGIK